MVPKVSIIHYQVSSGFCCAGRLVAAFARPSNLWPALENLPHFLWIHPVGRDVIGVFIIPKQALNSHKTQSIEVSTVCQYKHEELGEDPIAYV